MTNLYIAKEHHEFLPIWKAERKMGRSVLHLDFHDDLRGLLIDRKKGKAYRTGIFRTLQQPLDDGNFLAQAVISGAVQRIRWVRGSVGGRACDAGIVKYKEDIAALPHRLSHFLKRGKSFRLDFDEIIFKDWCHCDTGELLSMDWDFFASFNLNPEGIQKRFEQFLSRLRIHIPDEIYFCYSPRHVHPSSHAFMAAVESLSDTCRSAPRWVNGFSVSKIPAGMPERSASTYKNRVIRFFRRRGIF
jgi:hypothetical protein